MDKRDLLNAIDDVIEECSSCNAYHISLIRTIDDACTLCNLTETDIRALQVLVHRGELAHDEYYLKEWADGHVQDLHFRKDGRIAEEFFSHVYTLHTEMLYRIL